MKIKMSFVGLRRELNIYSFLIFITLSILNEINVSEARSAPILREETSNEPRNFTLLSINPPPPPV
jgi:hypothetical protein